MVKNFLIVQKKWTTDAIKTAWKRAIQKRAEAAGDLISNKTADKITSISKKSSAHLTELHSKIDNANSEIEVPRYISPEERQKIIGEIRLVSKKGVYF